MWLVQNVEVLFWDSTYLCLWQSLLFYLERSYGFLQYLWGPIQDRRQCGGSEGLGLVCGPDCVMNKSCVFVDTSGSQLRLPYPLTGNPWLLRVPGSTIQHGSAYNSCSRQYTTLKKGSSHHQSPRQWLRHDGRSYDAQTASFPQLCPMREPWETLNQ